MGSGAPEQEQEPEPEESGPEPSERELWAMSRSALWRPPLRLSRDKIRAARFGLWRLKFRDPHIPSYMPLSVEEASLTRDLSRWTNTRVRLVGVVRHKEIPWLVSFHEKGGQWKVALDITGVPHRPPYDGTPVQVFGLLEIEPQLNWPQILVLFFRRLEGGAKRYAEAMQLLNKYVPRYIK